MQSDENKKNKNRKQNEAMKQKKKKKRPTNLKIIRKDSSMLKQQRGRQRTYKFVCSGQNSTNKPFKG